MDAQAAQEKPLVDPPRHLFFGAEDRRQGGRAGLDEKYLTMETGRRHKLAQRVIDTADQLASAVRTLRSFDRTGNADMALDHIEQTLSDLTKYTSNLINEVTDSVDRFGDAMDRLENEDLAAEVAATEPQDPKPGPVINHILPPTPLAVPPRPWLTEEATLRLRREAALRQAQA